MKKFLNLKLFLHFFVLFVICNLLPLQLTKFLCSKFQESLNSKTLLPQNTPQSAFFGFPDNKENFEIIRRLRLIFKYYLLKSRETKKIV